jgi:autotransporter-associated beta strand protein
MIFYRFRILIVGLLFLTQGVVGAFGLTLDNNGDGDLLLGFMATTGTGQNTDYVINLGLLSSFQNATQQFTVLNVDQDLRSIYGSWSTDSNLYWGAIGGDNMSGNNPSFFASLPVASVGSPGTITTPYKSGSLGSISTALSDIQSLEGVATGVNYFKTATASNAIRQSIADPSSWASYNIEGAATLSFDRFTASIQGAVTGNKSVLELLNIGPFGGTRTPGSNVGYFSLDNLGNVIFTPATSGGSGGGVGYAGPWNWTAGSGNWSSSANWQSNNVASNGVAAGILSGSGGTITNDAVTTLSSLTFSNAAGGYTLTGTNASQALAVMGGLTNNSSATETIALGLTGAGNVTQNGAGTLILSASNGYSGGTILNGGTVVAANNSSFGAGVVSVQSNATIATGASITLTNTLGVSNGATATLNNAGYGLMENGAIGGNGALNLIGAGTTTLNSANSYSGGTTLNGGSVVAGNNASFGTGNIAVSSSATISAGVPNLAITNTMSIAAGQMAGLDTTGNSWTQSGAISGNGGLTKVSAGMLTLSGANTYSGMTLVGGGTLQVTGSLLGAGTVTVASGGTLSGTGYVGKTTIQSGGTISAGANGNIGNLSLSSLILNGGGAMNWKMLDAAGVPGIGYDTLGITGALDLSSLDGVTKFTINLQTLSSTNPAVSGSSANFNANVSTNWVIASYGNLTGTFSTNLFAINASGFANGQNGSFGISTNSSGLLLSYTTAFVAGASGEWNSVSGSLSSKPLITNGSSLLFSGIGGSVTNDSVSSLVGITFATNAGAYSFSGNAITNGGSGIINNSSHSQSISNAITLGAVQTFTAGGGSLTIAGNIGLSSNTLTITGSNNTLLSGVVTGTAGITKTGAGTLILSGADTFTGGVTISAGSLLLSGGDNRLWTNSSVSVAAGSLLNLGTNNQQLSSLSGSGTVTGQSSATLTLAPSNASSYAGTITGGEALAVTGSGTQTLLGSNSNTGGTIVNGTLVASNASALGATNNSLGVRGTLNLGSQTITQGQVTLSGGTITGGTLSATNVLLQGGTISANLAGSAGVTQSSGTTLLSGSNSYNGGVAVTGGTLVASNASALASGSVAVNGGTLNLTSVSEQVGSVTLGNGTITGSGVMTQTSVTATNSGLALVAESLAGTGGFTQNGAGTTTLSGSNSFTGGTLVSNGTLVASNARALGGTNANATIAGGKLDLGGFTQQVGSATLTSGSISNGTLNSLMGVTVTGNSNSTISATLAGSGGLSKTGSGTLNLNAAIPNGSVLITGGTMQSSTSVVGASNNAVAAVSVSNGAIWQNSGLLTVGGSSNATGSLTLASRGSVSASGLLIASASTSKGMVTLGDSNGGANLALGSGTISFGAGNGNLVFGQSGEAIITNQIVSLSPGKGTITSAGTGITTLNGNDSSFSGSTYLSSGTIVLGANSQLGGTVNIANKGAEIALNTGASLSGTGVDAVAGTLLDNSGLSFTNAIKGQIVLAPTGTLQKTYAVGSSVAGFGAGIGAGKTFSILAGTAASNTVSASLVNGALNFKGTFTNAAVMAITDPSFSAIKNTIQWYNPNTSTWQNTIQGNGQAGAVANASTNSILSGLGANSKLWTAAGFNGSFNTFLIDEKNLNLANGLTSLNALSSSLINSYLDKIMGAYGYDASTHTAWAVIDHNSIFDSGDASVSPDLNAAALDDTGVIADLSVFNSPVVTGAVPEPGEWGLISIGALFLTMVGYRQRRRLPGIASR